MEEEAEVEVEVEEVVEAEEEALEEHSLNPSIKEMLENKERCPRSSRETAPKLRNLSKICEATSA